MQVGQKKTDQAVPAAAADKPAVVKDAAASAGHKPFSPARALQARLASELSRKTSSWTWHSLGLVVTLLFATWLAAMILNASL